VTINVDTNQSPGTYEGQVNLSAQGGTGTTASISVTSIVRPNTNPVLLVVPGIFGSKIAKRERSAVVELCLTAGRVQCDAKLEGQ